MFTGIIQDVGEVASVVENSGQMHLQISTQLDTSHWHNGDSVAVDGVCLTLTAIEMNANESNGDNAIFSVTLSPETLAITTFKTVHIGQAVNLEPALRMGDAIGGHWVSGHVDVTASILKKHVLGGEHLEIRFSLPQDIADCVVKKGSITIAGVSLTVNELLTDDNNAHSFCVNIIPHTLSHTNLSALSIGDLVNIETDIMAKHVVRFLRNGNYIK
ncbi:MAG: riboflavin synthase [Mariprofundales bacterium]